MHKTGANEGGGSGPDEKQPLFEMPHRPEGQEISLGLEMPMWETVKGSFFKACIAEFFCMTLFIYAATGTVIFGCHSSDTSTGASASTGQVAEPQDCFLSESRVLTIATAFGFSIFVLVFVSASFSGGHLNPAVTLAFLISKKITLMRAFAYWCCQLLGAILGSSLVYATDRTGWHAASGATNRLLPGISKASGWLLESMLTMLLVIVVFAATDNGRAQISTHLPILAPFAIGMAVFMAHLAAVALDGCSINPARSFGPAVVSGVWVDQWIFWVGPFTGAVIAAVIYELLLRPSGEIVHPDEESDHPKEDEDLEAGEGENDVPKKRRHRHSNVMRLPTFAGVRGAHDRRKERPVKVVVVSEKALDATKGGADEEALQAVADRVVDKADDIDAVPAVAENGEAPANDASQGVTSV